VSFSLEGIEREARLRSEFLLLLKAVTSFLKEQIRKRNVEQEEK